MNKNRIFIIYVSISFILIIYSGCISDETESGGGNKKVELTISNITNVTVQLQINISFNDEIVYNESVNIEPEENLTINEFANGFGKYHIYLFIDDERIFENDTYITKHSFPPLFFIRENEIEFRQVRVAH